jgi:hypothetical protein
MSGEGPAVTVAAAGALLMLLGWIFGLRFLRLLGIGTALAGGALFAREKLAAREEKIAEAETAVRSALDDLDPIAKAQVIEEIVRSELADAD